MSEKTPEETAVRNAMLSLLYWAPTYKESRLLDGPDREIVDNACKTVDECIRAAVEAERERCLKDPEMLVSCTDCGAQVGSGCVDTDPDGMGDFIHASHDCRWEAAIRAEPDEKEANPIWGATARRVENEGGEDES